MNSPQHASRSRRRRALGVLAVVGGTYTAYRMVRRLRAVPQQSPGDVSLPPARPAVVSGAAFRNIGEHSEWVESFRAEQVRRLRSDPPAA